MDKLRVGILGLGRGIPHLRTFLSLDNVEVVGACDRLPLRPQRGQEHPPRPRDSPSDHRSLLRHEDR